ncbi:hypothetical protein DOTSEDRAFT_55821 [Dothistroma septosporum NZE10]|uniref:Uncharacterized protein n=1 Tax=Dothistroma septosporum (strain NZE10 / CBS 128990) TaxID=675120 RepID=N1PHB0_DOTSN|nr:hypothetical protein DOTSEDRAFT_55821 [Dothistroma septosporum NZE10]
MMLESRMRRCCGVWIVASPWCTRTWTCAAEIVLGNVDRTDMYGAIVVAIHARERDREGKKMHGSLFGTQVAVMTNAAMSRLNLGVKAKRQGTQHTSLVP